MSRSLEASPSASLENSALASADQLRPTVPSLFCNPYEPYLKMQEAGVLVFSTALSLMQPIVDANLQSLAMLDEMTGMGAELQRFDLLKHTDPDLYYGTPLTNGHKQIIMANGFTPVNPFVENAFVQPLMDYYSNIIPQLKSNAFLEPKRKWYRRNGHNAQFAFEGPNHIWYKNFLDTYQATSDAIDRGNEVWIDGLSGGGLLGEMVAKKLAKEGVAVNLITNGSPEVSEEILKIFDESVKHPGMMGQVHQLAKMSAAMDPGREKMAEEIYEASQAEFHPNSTVLRFYSNEDQICPKPVDPNAIEVGGKHAVIPYRKAVLEIVQKLLADQDNKSADY